MNKIFFAGLISLIGCLANAQQVYYDQSAFRICSSQSDDRDKRKCMEQIKGKKYDQLVIGICSTQSDDSDKRACLWLIENKRYLSPVEVSICSTQSDDSDKRRCLKNASTAQIGSYVSPVPVSLNVDQQVADAISAIQSNNYGRAESILQNLRNQIQILQQSGLQ
tara:strand:+ start:40071 stop:40565 length:495 start_codon:yes stop_codon:yes gene_type:complete